MAAVRLSSEEASRRESEGDLHSQTVVERPAEEAHVCSKCEACEWNHRVQEPHQECGHEAK